MSGTYAAAQPAEPGLSPCALLTKAEVQEASVIVLLFGQPQAKSKTVAQTLMRKALARVP